MFINFCHVVRSDKILFRALNKNPNIYYDIRGTPSVKLKKFAKKIVLVFHISIVYTYKNDIPKF